MNKATVIGAGFAGVEAARQLSRAGIRVTLCEMKPQKFSPAHSSPNFAELVCSNSFKALRTASAAGELKAEMELLGSLCVSCAKATAVPAGGALAVDRDGFSDLVTKTVEADPLIEVVRGEVTEIPTDGIVIIAACVRRAVRGDREDMSRASELLRCGGADSLGGEPRYVLRV